MKMIEVTECCKADIIMKHVREFDGPAMIPVCRHCGEELPWTIEVTEEEYDPPAGYVDEQPERGDEY